MSGYEIVQREVFDIPPGPATVGTSATVVIGPVNLLRYNTKTFTIKNLGPAAFNSGVVQATRVERADAPGTPSTNDSDWETIDSAAFATLAAGAIKSFQVTGDARKWWRVTATVAAATTGAQGYVTAGGVG